MDFLLEAKETSLVTVHALKYVVLIQSNDCHAESMEANSVLTSLSISSEITPGG